jgi:malonyl-CoA O-methyltransferase
MNFHSHAQTYDSVAAPQGELAEKLFDLSLDFLPDTPPTLLDVGCGTGALSLDLASLMPARLDCLDQSEAMLQVCEEKLSEYFPDARWRLFAGDAETFEPDGLYHAVYAASCLQWFKDPAAFLKKTRKWLHPKGLCAVGTFGPKTLAELHSAYTQATGRPLASKARFWSEQDLTRLFEKAGFSVEESASALYTQNFKDSRELLRGLKTMGVAGAGEKPLAKTEATKLLQLLPPQATWELVVAIGVKN